MTKTNVNLYKCRACEHIGMVLSAKQICPKCGEREYYYFSQNQLKN
jgi:rubrerythrin